MRETNTTAFVTSTDGTRIAYTRTGDGPPVVLVDGAFCYRENGPMPNLAAALAPHFTVLFYDRRGRGESSDRAPYSISREVDDLAAVIAVAGEVPSVFGMSSGAGLALQAAATGVAMRKLVLYEPPYMAAASQKQSFAEAGRALSALVASGRRADAVRYFLTNVFGAPAFFARAMPFVMPRAWRKNKSVAHTLAYDMAILDDRSVLGERVEAITVPTTVLAGERSPEALREAAGNVAQALPNARLQVLPRQSHNLNVDALVPVLRTCFAP